MDVTGNCHCGAIQFKTKVDEDQVVICHCTDCQIMSGGPYRSIATAKEEDFELLRGQPKLYFKVGESGNKRELGFCDTCGSHLYATSAEPNGERRGKRELGIRTGTLREGGLLKPGAQVWCQSTMPWSQDLTGLPKKEKQS